MPSIDKLETLRNQNTLRRFKMALASLSDAEQNLLYLRYHQAVRVKKMAERYDLTIRAVNARLRQVPRKMEQFSPLHVPA